MATDPIPCRWCGATAVVKYAVMRAGTPPRTSLRDAPRFACAQHFPEQVASSFAGQGIALVVDPEFSADVLPAAPAGDETRPMQPIRETVRRRPPAVGIEELKGAALLRALADELDRDPDIGPGEQL
jgi:hypothetical protein